MGDRNLNGAKSFGTLRNPRDLELIDSALLQQRDPDGNRLRLVP